MKSKNVLNKVVNVCGKVVDERQEQLSLILLIHTLIPERMNDVWYGRLG